MKKIIKLLILIFFVNFFNILCFAEEASLNDSNRLSQYEIEEEYVCDNLMIVTESDIYNLCDQYQNQKISSQDEALNTLRAYAREYAFNQLCKDYEYNMIAVCDEAGEVLAYIRGLELGNEKIKMYSVFGDEFFVTENKEAMKKSLGDIANEKKEIKKKYNMLREQFTDDQYGYIYYDPRERLIHAGITDEAEGEIEDDGIVYEKTDVSYASQLKDLKKLWENREELGITYAEFSNAAKKICVYGILDENVFWETCDLDFVGEVQYEQFIQFGDLGVDPQRVMEWVSDSYPLSEWDVQNRENFTDVIDVAYTDGEVEHLKNLETALDEMKKIYPEYSYENLFLLIYRDFQAEKYLDFESDLENWAETVEYKCESMNPFEENMYGDSQRICLKALMTALHNQYPKLSYDEIYHQYIKEKIYSEDDSLREQRYACLWKMYFIEEETKKAVTGTDMYTKGIISCMLLLVGCGCMIAYMKYEKSTGQ